MTTSRASLIAVLLLAGCEEHGKSPDGGVFSDAPFSFPDASFSDGFMPIDGPPGSNPGFVEPATLVRAWTETSPSTFEAATLDLSCLKVTRVDLPTTTAITVTATIQDFQSGNAVSGAMVAAFDGTAIANPFTTQTANGSGVATLTVPAGKRRFGYELSSTNARPTFVFDQLLAPSTAAQAVTLRSLSNATAQTLPALIGVSATPTRAISIGTITDCQGHTLSGAIATVSSVSLMATHLAGADTYYFSESVGLPVRHSQAGSTTKNGMFMVIELPTTPQAFVQVWAFRNGAEQSMHILTELAELAVPLPSSSVAVTTHDPRATQ